AQSGTSTEPFSAMLPSTASASGRRNRSPPLSQMSQGSVLTTRTWHRRAALLIDLHSRVLWRSALLDPPPDRTPPGLQEAVGERTRRPPPPRAARGGSSRWRPRREARPARLPAWE